MKPRTGRPATCAVGTTWNGASASPRSSTGRSQARRDAGREQRGPEAVARPPEVVADVMHRGIVLVGGGSMLAGLKILLERELKIPIHQGEDPLTAVVRGTGIILEHFEAYKDVLIDDENQLPPR